MSLIPIYKYFDLEVNLDLGRSSSEEIFISGTFEDMENIVALKVSNGGINKVKRKDSNEFNDHDHNLFVELIKTLKDNIISKYQQHTLNRYPKTESEFDIIRQLFEENPGFDKYDLMFGLLKSFCKPENYSNKQILLFGSIHSSLQALQDQEAKKSVKSKLAKYKQFFINNPNMWESNEMLANCIRFNL